jgi:peptide/nickel transport system permease protein
MHLFRFITHRILHTIPILIGVSVVTFYLINQSPGNYLSKLKLDPHLSDEFIIREEKRLGLDKPWYTSYLYWLRGIVWGENRNFTPPGRKGGCLNFGYSFAHNKPVFDVLGERALNTCLIAFCAMLFAWLVAIPLGILAGSKQYSATDKIASSISFLGLSIPDVFLALLAIYFAKITGWFPTGGLIDVRNWDDMTAIQKLGDRIHHLVLPTIVLGSAMTATLMRHMRGQILDVLQSDFIRTARAKGLDRKVVLFKHAVRNAINPLITLFGYHISSLLSGAFLVEVVMSLPGLGRTTIQAFFEKDLFLVTGSVLLATFMLVTGNLVADILLAISDPRITFQKGDQ